MVQGNPSIESPDLTSDPRPAPSPAVAPVWDWAPALLLAIATLVVSLRAPAGAGLASPVLLLAGIGLLGLESVRWLAAAVLAWGLWHVALTPASFTVAGISISIQGIFLALFFTHAAISSLMGHSGRLAIRLQIAVSILFALCALPTLAISGGFPPTTAIAWVHAVAFLFAVEPLARIVRHRRPRRAVAAYCLALAAILVLQWVGRSS